MNDTPQREMPRYQCHKVVHALRLRTIVQVPNDHFRLVPHDPQYADLRVDWDDPLAVRLPDVDADPGYLVVYQDGFRSWSPTKAFEEGYSKLG